MGSNYNNSLLYWLLLFLVSSTNGATDWGKLTAEILAVLSPKEFSNATSDDISLIPPDACKGFQKNQIWAFSEVAASGITGACLSHFPTEACEGLTRGVVRSLNIKSVPGLGGPCMGSVPPEATEGWTPEQVSKFSAQPGGACSGLKSLQLRVLPPLAYSGLSPHCIHMFGEACRGFVREGVSSLKVESISGLSRECMEEISAEVLGGFSAEMVAHFSGDVDGACAGILSSVVNFFSVVQMEAFTLDCLKMWPASTINNMTSSQLKTLSDQQVQGFQENQVALFLAGTLLNFRLSQLGNFSESGIRGFSSEQLLVLYRSHGLSFVTLYNQIQSSVISYRTIIHFKWFFVGDSPLLVGVIDLKDPIISNISDIQWLEMTFIADQAIEGVLTKNSMPTLAPVAVYGIRLGHVHRLSVDVFSVITPVQGQYLLHDVISEASGEQLAALTPETFSKIQAEVIPYIPLNTVPFLTKDQLEAMVCPQVLKLTKQQLEMMNDTQRGVLNRVTNACTIPPSPPSPGPKPLPPLAWIGIGIGASMMGIVIIVVGIGFWFKNRRDYMEIR